MTTILWGAVALGLMWAVVTIGVYITYRILDIADLTVEGTITLGASISAAMITSGVNPYVATVAALCGGALAGLSTGLLHTRLKIPALLSGILSQIALWSVNLHVMGKANVSMLRMDTIYTALEGLGGAKAVGLSAKNLSVVLTGLLVCTGLVVVLYWFFGTELGCAVRATGNNQKMVRAQGINNDTMKILGLMISNALVGLAGAMIAQYQSFADISMGMGSIVIALASLIIGEVLFARTNFASRLIAVILGAIIYRLIIALVLKLGMPANDLKLFTAITVAVCLSLPMFRSWLNTLKKSAQREEE